MAMSRTSSAGLVEKLDILNVPEKSKLYFHQTQLKYKYMNTRIMFTKKALRSLAKSTDGLPWQIESFIETGIKNGANYN